MRIELSRFRIKEGKEEKAREWMEALRARRDECVETLDREKMVAEAIFREEMDGRMYLYWFTIQEENGATIDDSPHPIDKYHREMWAECIEPGSRTDLTLENFFSAIKKQY